MAPPSRSSRSGRPSRWRATTSALSFRTSTTARLAGTTASGASEALRTSARPIRPSVARPASLGRRGARPLESQGCNLARTDGSARTRCLELRTGAARGVRDRAGPSSFAAVRRSATSSGNCRAPSRRTVRIADSGARHRLRRGTEPRPSEPSRRPAVRWSDVLARRWTGWRFVERPQELAAVRRSLPRDRDERRAGRSRQAREIRLALVALVAEGHLLIEDVPGVGKTMLAKAVARSIDCSFRRIQFTPDLLPTDVTGVNVFNQEQRRLRVQAGRHLRQHRARRRDQPRLPQDAVGPPGVHGGAAGHGRHRDAPARDAVHGDRHAEPDRARGHLPAARGAARPVHAAAVDRLPDAPRSRRRSWRATAPGRRSPISAPSPTRRASRR